MLRIGSIIKWFEIGWIYEILILFFNLNNLFLFSQKPRKYRSNPAC